MKLCVLIVACMAIVAVQTVSAEVTEADQTLLEKQRFVFEILYRMDNKLQFEEWIKFGLKLITDKSQYEKYEEFMEMFEQYYKGHDLLPRGQHFAIMQRMHVRQAYGLFRFFYYAKDWDTFAHNVAWARLHLNEGLFVWAFNLAAIHREDMKGIVLPQIYEIFPQMFFNSKYILAAEELDWDSWNREIMLEKELKVYYGENFLPNFIGKSFYMKDWKVWQWWKLMGLDDGWQLEGKSILRENMEELNKDPLWTSIHSNLKMAWIPVDYTRDTEVFNEDSVISYFTEDVGWNAYWYYLNMDFQAGLPVKEFDLPKERRGEWWIFNVQQLLARYYMERLSQGLGDFETLSWYGVVKTGYNPHLITYKGEGFTQRKNYWEVQSYKDVKLFNRILNIERRIDDMFASGKFVSKDGSVVDLTLPGAVEHLGNTLHSNLDILDANFLGYWWVYVNKFLSGSEYHDYSVVPNVIQNYETMLRDPLTYEVFSIIYSKYYQFKYQLPAYTVKELYLPGVKIVDVEVSKLMTYFDLTDIDITTLYNDKMLFHNGKFVWNKALLARQSRLNHVPFNYTLTVESEKELDVVYNVFLGPVFDKYGQKLSIVTDREKFVKIDKFHGKLVSGKNEVFRSSEDFIWTSKDPFTYSEWYNYLTLAYEGKFMFNQSISESHSLFPDRLILPHGWVKGMPMGLFFMVSPVDEPENKFLDNKPFGWPLDRKIESLYSFFVPNMYWKDVMIYHEDKYTKYFPTKYENYGSFDYDY